MDDFGDDLFDDFEKPSATSFSAGVQKPNDDKHNSDDKYEPWNLVKIFFSRF